MVFSTKFSLPSFLKQVNKLTENQRNSITKVGFGNLLHIPNHVLRRLQLEELMERWNSERKAFVFPPGEITITLLDVSLILGLRVIGQPVILEEDGPLTSLEKEFGASKMSRTIGVESLKNRLESLGECDDEFFVQTFLLYCFGTLLFPSANGKVDSRYLSLLQDLDNVSSFAWGAAVVQELHDCLSQKKSEKKSFIGGCLILLQIWCYEHIIKGRPNLLDYPFKFPRVCRWECSGRQYSTSSQFAINFEELDHTQILWRLKPTSTEMQVDIIKEIPQEPGTMEQPLEVDSENRTVRDNRKEKEEEEETPILRTGPGTKKCPIDVASERNIRKIQNHTEEEEETPSGVGTMKHPIVVASEKAIIMARAHREKEEDEEEEEEIFRTGTGTMKLLIDIDSEKSNRVHQEEEVAVSKEKSSILFVSNDEELKMIEDLKKEVLELKEKNEKLEDLKKVLELKEKNEKLEELKEKNKKLEDEIEELRKLVEKQHLESMERENFISNLEKIVFKEDEDDDDDDDL